MSYDGESGLTKAFIHCMDYKDLLRSLEQTMSLARHPLLLPIIIAGLVIGISSKPINSHQKTITEVIEVATGQNEYTFAKKVNRLTIRHRSLTKQTNELITNLVWTEMKLKSLSLFYDQLDKSGPDCWNDIKKSIPLALKGMIEHQRSVTDNLLLSSQNVRERAQSQLSVVRRPSKGWYQGRT
jgi:hypothetical protein